MRSIRNSVQVSGTSFLSFLERVATITVLRSDVIHVFVECVADDESTNRP